MTAAAGGPPTPTWWAVTIAVLRAILTAAVLVALYYVLPLDLSDSGTATVVKLVIAVGAFLGLLSWNVRAISQSDTPGLRALEGLMVVVPLFILVFAATYFMMSRGSEESFTAPLTRSDSLYFTVTIFSTVGFGDISARAESARLVVTAQMMLDLIILGLGVRIILNAVQKGRDRLTGETAR